MRLSPEEKRERFIMETRAIRENLNYAPKCQAIMKLAVKRKPRYQRHSALHSIKIARAERGDTEHALAKRHNRDPEQVSRLNPAILDMNRQLPEGYEVRLTA